MTRQSRFSVVTVYGCASAYAKSARQFQLSSQRKLGSGNHYFRWYEGFWIATVARLLRDEEWGIFISQLNITAMQFAQLNTPIFLP